MQQKLHIDLVEERWNYFSSIFETSCLGPLPKIDGYFSVKLKARPAIWSKEDFGYRVVLSISLLNNDWQERLLESACHIYSDFHINDGARSLLWFICYSVVDQHKFIEREEAAASVIISNLLAKGNSLFSAKMEFIARFSMVPQSILEPLFENVCSKLSLK